MRNENNSIAFDEQLTVIAHLRWASQARSSAGHTSGGAPFDDLIFLAIFIAALSAENRHCPAPEAYKYINSEERASHEIAIGSDSEHSNEFVLYLIRIDGDVDGMPRYRS